MNVIEQHVSPDGLLKFIVWRRDDGDISLGFDGHDWHTHADLLASLSGLNESTAVRQFVDDVLSGRSIIAIARVGNVIRDIWVTDDSPPDKYKPDDETIKFRYWDGSSAM